MYQLMQEHGVVIGGTIAACLLMLAFGLGWALAGLMWLRPGVIRHVIRGK